LILDGEKVLASVIGQSSTNPGKTAKSIYEKCLADAGLTADQVAYVVGTGYGRAQVPFANENISEISCHGRGAHFILPGVRTVLDIGGQDTKAISIDDRGGLLDFAMNDKCAAGTGRFLEAIIRSMDISIEALGDYHFMEGEPATISSMCSVFAESEVINLVNEGVPLARIIKGLHNSLANRVASLANRLGLTPEIVVTGGVAKNKGVIDALAKKLNLVLLTFPEGADPQLMGALGAALIGRDRLAKK
jgi:predicted CoA-substrate-specific enzyme activase